VATTSDGNFIKLRSRAQAAHLMSAIAGFARPATSHDLPVTLDAADNRALAAAAMPLNAEEGYPASVMTIPLIGHEGTRVDPGKLVAFRHNEKNKSARQDYLNSVAAVVADKMARTVNGEPTTLAAEKILTDMQKATTSFADRVKDTLSIEAIAIEAVPVMVPFALNGARLSDAALAAASAVAAGALKLRMNRPHRYIRRAKPRSTDGLVAERSRSLRRGPRVCGRGCSSGLAARSFRVALRAGVGGVVRSPVPGVVRRPG
jgi:hypothetical protein